MPKINLKVKILCAIIPLLGFIFGCNQVFQHTNNEIPVGFCDVENECDGFEISSTKNTERAFSGNFSVRLNKDIPVSLVFKYTGVKSDDVFQLSVWKWGEAQGSIVFYDKSENASYQLESRIVKEKNGWQQLQAFMYFPPFIKDSEAKFFLYNPEQQPVWFDDFKVTKLKTEVFPQYSDVDHLEIYMDTEAMGQLKRNRVLLAKNSMQYELKDKWVNGELTIEYEPVKAKIRLKGDRMSNIMGEKWSLRIELCGKNKWKDFGKFSIHRPEFRSFIKEWLMRKFFKKESVFITNYGFVPVSLNDKSLGIYAYEEHMTKSLLKKQGRVGAVIIKMDDKPFWDAESRGETDRKPAIMAAEIEVFGNRNKTDNAQFEKAKKLLDSFRNMEKGASEIFDVAQTAKYYALCDVLGAYHGNFWINERWWFNPEEEKLEPIGHDGYGMGEFTWLNAPFFGYAETDTVFVNDYSLAITLNLFNDPIFTEKYLKALEKYAKKGFVEQILAENNDSIAHYEELLKREYPYYQYNASGLQENAKAIRYHLEKYKKRFVDAFPVFVYR
ncbi:MAG: hypothetical protein COA57_16265 [Flavobacteriales bacterium]|nr:MAG: hypothetical protein COA57_16265 [Flavobacteriales bacterium]